MKDSAMILVVTAILAVASLPALVTMFGRMAKATDTIEQVRMAAHLPTGLRAITSSNKVVRLHSVVKTWRSL